MVEREYTLMAEPIIALGYLKRWPITIVSAKPTMNPFRTGSEMKLARNPAAGARQAMPRGPW